MTHRLKQPYALFGGTLVPTYGQPGVDYLLHTRPDATGILLGYGMPDAHIAVVTVGDGNVNANLSVGIKVVYGLAKHEEKGADVGALTRQRVQIEELNVLAVIHAEVHSHLFVVHLCAHRAVFHVDIELPENFRKCTSDAYVLGFFVIFAPYLYYMFHCCYS